MRIGCTHARKAKNHRGCPDLFWDGCNKIQILGPQIVDYYGGRCGGGSQAEVNDPKSAKARRNMGGRTRFTSTFKGTFRGPGALETHLSDSQCTNVLCWLQQGGSLQKVEIYHSDPWMSP